MTDVYLGILRHLLTIGGTWAVTNGFLTDSDATSVVGAIVTIGSIAWSVFKNHSISKPPTAA